VIAGDAERDEEAKSDERADERQDHAPLRGHGVDEAGEAEMAAAQGGQRRDVIGQPGERDAGNFVVPDERMAEPAERETGDHDQRDRDHEHEGDRFKHAIVEGAE
jgi:hypothetical protein